VTRRLYFSSISLIRISAARGAMFDGDGFGRRNEVIDLRRTAVEFDDEKSFSVQRIASVDEGLRGFDGEFVHNLHAAGDDSGADHGRDAIAGAFDGRKADEQGAGAGRRRQHPHRNFRDDAEQAFPPDEHPEQIVVAGVEMLATQAYDLAIHRDEFDADDVTGREAIFEAMHAAVGDIAANRTGDLTRRIGRVIKPLGLDGMGDAEIGDAGLHHRG